VSSLRLSPIIGTVIASVWADFVYALLGPRLLITGLEIEQ
jgi:hypothetical protein